tara:strand:- start:226 stop:417 length:192 start_codon:yes stop_codon:yes gene_type:complete
MTCANSNANFKKMKNKTETIQNLRAKAQASLNKTSHLQQALAQIEANLSRKEIQKVTEKSQHR